MIPQEIKDKIKEASKERATSIGKKLFIEQAEYGYSLAQHEIERILGLLKRAITAEKSECHPRFREEVWNMYKENNNL